MSAEQLPGPNSMRVTGTKAAYDINLTVPVSIARAKDSKPKLAKMRPWVVFELGQTTLTVKAVFLQSLSKPEVVRANIVGNPRITVQFGKQAAVDYAPKKKQEAAVAKTRRQEARKQQQAQHCENMRNTLAMSSASDLKIQLTLRQLGCL